MNARPIPRLAAVLALAAAAICAQQRDCALEDVVRAAEGRLGLAVMNLNTGASVSVNGDVDYPAGALMALFVDAPPADSRPGAASRPARVSSRRVVQALAARLRLSGDDITNPFRRTMIAAPRGPVGGRLSPATETGCMLSGGDPAAAVAGYVRLAGNDVCVCVMTEGFRTADNARALFPAVTEAAIRLVATHTSDDPRRAAESRAADGPAPRIEDTIVVTLHDARHDAALFPKSPAAAWALADTRRNQQRLSFGITDAPRIGVLIKPHRTARVAVTWIPPGRTEPQAAQTLVEAGASDALIFDGDVSTPGRWKVRVAVDARIVLDESFFVTLAAH